MFKGKERRIAQERFDTMQKWTYKGGIPPVGEIPAAGKTPTDGAPSYQMEKTVA
jgi:hypothetical protein